MLKNLLTQASTSRSSSSSKAPKEKFSLENLKYLYGQLVKYPIVDTSNAARIVEVLRSIAELMIWGDQHNPLFFDFFAEKNMIANFAKILRQQHADTKVKTQVVQTLSILISNTDSEQAVFYLLSNNYINDLIVTKFDFNDEELLANYISFLKSLSFKLNNRTILFFYNDKANDFPLYVEALKFFAHTDTMVRTAVRTLTLNIYKVDDTRMRRFIIDRTSLPYFSNLVWSLRDQTLALSRLIETTPVTSSGKLEEYIENMIDFMLYMQDVLSLSIEKMNGIMTDQLLAHYIFPVLIGSLVARYDPEKRKQQAQEQAKIKESGVSNTNPLNRPVLGLLAALPQRDNSIQARLALFMLSQIFQCFQHSGLINSVTISLLHPKPPVICETLVRTPIKFPFRHPKTSLTAIIYPKSATVPSTPSASVVAQSSTSSNVSSSDSVDHLTSTTVTDSGTPDLPFSPRYDDTNNSRSSSPAPRSNGDDSNNIPELFSPSNSSQSMEPSVNTLQEEHAALFDMFSGKAPTSPTATVALPAAAKESESSPPATPVPNNTGTLPKPKRATSTTNTDTSTPRGEPTTPTTVMSLSQSSSASSLSNLRRSLHKSASSLTTFITGSKSLGVGSLDAPLGVVTGVNNNLVYVLDSGNHRVVVYDRSGNQQRVFGKKGKGDGELMECEGITIHPKDNVLFVTDHNNHRVSIFDTNGAFVKTFGSEGSGPGEFQHPTGIAVSCGTGLVYVVDSWNHRVQIFDSNHNYVRSIGGKKGDGDGELSEPAHVAVCQSPLDPTADRVYVTDYGNDRVQVFDQLGTFLLKFGATGKDKGEFIAPIGLTISNDLIYLVDRGNHRIQVYDLQGAFVRQFGKRGNGSGELNEPNGVAVASDGRLYVTDTANNRLVVFMTATTSSSTSILVSPSQSNTSSSDATSLASPSANGDASASSNSLSVSHSTDELVHSVADQSPPVDANLRARSSLPEMKVVYNPEKSCPSYAQAAPQNRSKQAVMFALGSQDERVGFSALGLMFSIMRNELVDPEILVACGLGSAQLRKQNKLLTALTNSGSEAQLSTAVGGSKTNSSTPTPTAGKAGANGDEDSDSDIDDESSDEESESESEKEDKATNAKPDAAASAFDFFAGAASPTAAKAASATKPTVSSSGEAASTFELLASFTSPSSHPEMPQRSTSSDPLMDVKPVLAPIQNSDHNISSITIQTGSVAYTTDNTVTFDYSTEIVSKMLSFLKPRVPPVRLTTTQLTIEMIKELTVITNNPNHPSLTESHLSLVRDANRAVSDELKMKFKIPPLGNFLLDIFDEEFQSLSLTVYPKALIANPRNLLGLEEKQLTGVGLEWRRAANEFEKSRKLLQAYLLLRTLRYTLTKKKDPFFPLNSNQSTVKLGDEFSLESAVLVPCVASYSTKPLLLCIDTDVAILIAKAEGKSTGKVEAILPLAAQEPFAVRTNPAALNFTMRTGMRPHPAARKVKAGPGVAIPTVNQALLQSAATAANSTSPPPSPAFVPIVPNADNLTLAQVSGQKPMWNLQLVFGDAAAATSVRKTLEQQRIRIRKANMNKIYKSFEQRREEITTTIAAPVATAATQAQANGAPPLPSQPAPIVPFSILNLLGDRQAEIVEEED